MHCLNFPDQTTFNTACQSAGLWISNEPPRPLLLSHRHTLTILGDLSTPENAVEGFHVNAIFIDGLPEGWSTYVVSPSPPHSVYL